ncbi:MAG: adenylate kinase [Ruminococcaceae bacterium]|nr:adenylate kinase [Oscillospiraceae bacterium]
MIYPYQRVMIIGSPGSGKSTFARALHRLTDLPLIYLDRLFWRADKTTLSREEFVSELQRVLSGERWIIDGNYSFTMELRLQRADQVIFLDYPADICLDGIRKRRNQPREDMPWIETEEDPAFMDFVRNFTQDRRPKILALLAKYPDTAVTAFHTRDEADAYLQKWVDGQK